MLFKIALCLLTFFIVSEVTAEIGVIPESRHIDAVETFSFTIEMTNDNETNITHCYYEAGSIVGDFELRQFGDWDDDDLTGSNNIVNNFGRIGECKIEVIFVDSEVPRSWAFTAFDANKTENYTQTFEVTFFYKAPVLIKSIFVRNTGAFLQYLLMNETVLNACHVGFNGIQVELKTDSTAIIPPPNISIENKNLTDRMESLGEGMCGVKLTNIFNTDPLNWNLTAVDNNDKAYGGTFKLRVNDVSTVNRTIMVELGDTVNVTCGLKNTEEQDFCYLYNPSKELVYSGDHCNRYSIQNVKIYDNGTWKCTAGITGAMDILEYTTELIVLELESVDVWVQETENLFKIGCALRNYKHTKDADYCEFAAPNKQAFLVRPGYATKRYTSIGTDLSHYICGMEIRKPVLGYEKGIWKCSVTDSLMTTGGFVKLLISEIPEYPKKLNQTVLLNKPFSIKCSVPYSSEYCFIQAPNSSKYYSDVYKSRLGECYFSVEQASASDNGVWTCSFARTMGTPNDLITVQVYVAEQINYPVEEEISLGDQIDLMCSSQGIAMEYCQYISPTGETYFIHNHAQSDILSYRGLGLEYGECGVTVKGAQTQHAGKWTCVVKLVGNDTIEILESLKVTILAQGTSSSTSVGISLGVIAVVAVVAGFVFYIWRKRRLARPRAAQNEERISNSSGTDIPIFNLSEATTSRVE